MTELIQCYGSINTNGTTYMDPLVNVYYLSYNGSAPIYAFPQIVNGNLNVLDQLFMSEIQADPGKTTRNDVINVVIMLLEKEYPFCKFTKTTL